MMRKISNQFHNNIGRTILAITLIFVIIIVSHKMLISNCDTCAENYGSAPISGDILLENENVIVMSDVEDENEISILDDVTSTTISITTTPVIDLNPNATKIKNECFLYQKDLHVLPTMLQGKTKPNAPGKVDKNIFFHETSCTKDGVIKLTAREACAIESAARENPDWEVFVLFAAKVGFNNATRLPIIDQLTSYSNIHFRHVDIDSYVKGTPLEDWLAVGDIYKSVYFNVHLADTLRLLSLWKYGGTYLDLDVVVLKSFNSLMTNYAGEESENYIANGVINFDSQKGHHIVDECLRELTRNYDGLSWGNNGPYLVTKVLQKLCNTTLSTEITHEHCNFQVLPIDNFYAIPYTVHRHFFDPDTLDDVLGRIKDSYLVHIWNKLNFDAPLRTGSAVAYGILADIHCNKVYRHCGENF